MFAHPMLSRSAWRAQPPSSNGLRDDAFGSVVAFGRNGPELARVHLVQACVVHVMCGVVGHVALPCVPVGMSRVGVSGSSGGSSGATTWMPEIRLHRLLDS